MEIVKFLIMFVFLLPLNCFATQQFFTDCEAMPLGELNNGTENNPFDDINMYGSTIGVFVSDDFAHSGTKSIKISYGADEDGVELQVNDLSPLSDSIYTRNYEYYAPGWEGHWPVGLKT